MSRYTRRTSSRLGRFERQKFGGLDEKQGFGILDLDAQGIRIPADIQAAAYRSPAPTNTYDWRQATFTPTKSTPTKTDDGWDYGTDASDEDIIKNWESAYVSQRKADKAAGIGVPKDSGINWGDVGGFFTGLIGAAAPIAGGIYMSGQQADAQKDMMQLMLQGGRASAQPATVIIREGSGGGGKSKMGLYIGLGVAGLIVLLGGIILIAR